MNDNNRFLIGLFTMILGVFPINALTSKYFPKENFSGLELTGMIFICGLSLAVCFGIGWFIGLVFDIKEELEI